MEETRSTIREQRIWSFIGIILAVIGIWLAYRALTDKSIEYQIVANTPLVSTHELLDERLAMVFDGQSITNVSLVVLRITNTGDDPITASDYELPLTFAFGDQASVLSTNVSQTTPPGIPVHLTQQRNTVALSPTLLNEDDSIEFHVLVTDFQSLSIVSCRIADVKACELVDPDGSNWFVSSIPVALVYLVIFVLYMRVARWLYKRFNINILYLLVEGWMYLGIFSIGKATFRDMMQEVMGLLDDKQVQQEQPDKSQ